MELTVGGIQMLNANSSFKPTLKFVHLLKSVPEVELVLSDGKDFSVYIIDESISEAFRREEIQREELLQILRYEVGNPIRILSFQTSSSAVYSQPVDVSGEVSDFIPISTLNPHNSDFVIKARILKKGEVHQWKKSNTSFGKVFSIELIDSNSDEINAVFFDSAVNKYFDFLREGEVHVFSKGTVNFNEKGYGSNKYQLLFDDKSSIIPTNEDPAIPKIKFNLTTIQEIVNCKTHARIDVAGIIVKCSALVPLLSKQREPLHRRTVLLGDRSGMSIELTLWNDFAKHSDFEKISRNTKHVLVIKNALVKEFNGRSLSTIRESTLHFNPDTVVAKELQKFAVQNNVNAGDLTALSMKSPGKPHKMVTIDQVLLDPIPDSYFDIMARIRYIKYEDRSLWYESCVYCKKKVMKDCDRYICNGGNSCGQVSLNCGYRYLVLMKLQDSSGSFYVTAFDECATKILGYPAEHIKNMQENTPEEFTLFMKSFVLNEYLFTIRAKSEVTEDGSKYNMIIYGVKMVNPVKVTRILLKDIVEKLNNS